jgi:hypothetical protein
LPAGSYRELSQDSAAERAGDAEMLLSLPRYAALQTRMQETPRVVELKLDTYVSAARLGAMPAGTRLGYGEDKDLEWLVLGAPATVLGHRLPKGTLITFHTDNRSGHAAPHHYILGGIAKFGPNRFLGGDEIQRWPEGTDSPRVVVLNERHTFGRKRYEDASKVSFAGDGTVVDVITAEELLARRTEDAD